MDKIIELLLENDNIFKGLGISICAYLILRAFRRLFSKIIFRFTKKIKIKNDVDDKIVEAFQIPFKYIYTSVSIYVSALIFIKLGVGVNVQSLNLAFSNKILGTIIVLCLTRGLYCLTLDESEIFDSFKRKFEIQVDAVLFPFVEKCIKVSIIFIAGVIILEIWDIKVSLLVTSLGLGGLAISLAAKDAAANVIAGVIIILEKPFNIGDWVLSNGVEGTVEDISFRSTRIRTFSQELVIVPNSQVTNSSITNFSKRGKRRVTFKLGVEYKTPKDKIKSCVEKIENMLIEHSGVNKDTILVSFDSFNNSSLDIFIYFFTNTIVWSEHLKVKQDINFKILDILNEEDVACAFPSTSIYMETPIIQEKNQIT